MDRSRCLVLTPFVSAIESPCQDMLAELKQLGYPVRCVRGYSAIDYARNELATQALDDGYEATMWVDSDISFDAEAVDRLRDHELPLVGALYAKKGLRKLACNLLPGTKNIQFGAKGGLFEVLYCGVGCLFVRRDCYRAIQEKLQLPVCNQRFGKRIIPFFQPMVVDQDWYLTEDYAFCERARQCGFKIMVDTSIRTSHHGSYGYTWEDIVIERERFNELNLTLT